MARPGSAIESPNVSDRSSKPDDIVKDPTIAADSEAKGFEPSLLGGDGVAAIPKGTIDPVYEAKARVLNHAVWIFLHDLE